MAMDEHKFVTLGILLKHPNHLRKRAVKRASEYKHLTHDGESAGIRAWAILQRSNYAQFFLLKECNCIDLRPESLGKLCHVASLTLLFSVIQAELKY